MGEGAEYRCKKCRIKFDVHGGYGMRGINLFCETCGQSISMELFGNGPKHLEFLDRIYMVSGDKDKQQKAIEKYNVAIEKHVGRCKCGGRYSYFALAACPKCHTKVDSEKIVKLNEIMWD